MSHDQHSLHRMASSTPSSPERRDALDLPPQPGIWLDPIVTGA